MLGLLYDFHLYCGSEKNHLCYIAKRDTPQYISKINSVVQIYEQNLNVQIFVGVSGFEPEPREPKSLVLPLHHTPIPPALSHGRAPDSHLLVRVHGPRRHYRNAINVQTPLRAAAKPGSFFRRTDCNPQVNFNVIVREDGDISIVPRAGLGPAQPLRAIRA